MKCPADVYHPSPRAYQGLPDLTYPFHDHTVSTSPVVGRICLHRKKINLRTVFCENSRLSASKRLRKALGS